MSMRQNIFLSTSLMVLSLAAYAIELTPATLKAQAAGYKAAFTCSATFNANKSLELIKNDELSGIRVDYREYFTQLPDAEIHFQEKFVSVWYSQDMPPRYAFWRPGLGCVQLPTGASLDAREFVVTADLSQPPSAETKPWPFGDKLASKPAASAELKAVVSDVFNSAKYGDPTRTSAVLISSADELLIEKYKAGYTPFTSQRTWSTAKSIAATIIGVAAHKNLLAVKAPANIPEWSAPGDPRQTITLENLLHMASGLDSTKAGNRTSYVYYGGGLVTDNATEKMLEAPPGKRWKYANNDTMLAIRSLKASLGDTEKMLRFPYENLFWKIGMFNTVAETDWQGNFILSSQVWSTARDLGRLGILYLNNGYWNDQQILPENWREYVSSPAPAQPPHYTDSGTPRAGYGAQFWLYPSRFPGMPDDAFSSAGNRGQYMMIIPSKNLVVVRRGYDAADGRRFNIAKFAADVIRAID